MNGINIYVVSFESAGFKSNFLSLLLAPAPTVCFLFLVKNQDGWDTVMANMAFWHVWNAKHVTEATKCP